MEMKTRGRETENRDKEETRTAGGEGLRGKRKDGESRKDCSSTAGGGGPGWARVPPWPSLGQLLIPSPRVRGGERASSPAPGPQRPPLGTGCTAQ